MCAAGSFRSDKKPGGFPLLSFDWQADLDPEYLCDAEAYLNQADCEMAKENARRLATKGDALMDWGEDIRIAARHVQFGRMVGSMGLEKGVRQCKGVVPSVAGQLIR